jgi:hypothetical protein
MKLLLRCLWLVLLAACATSGTHKYADPLVAPDGMATLVLYREWGYRGSFFDNHFFVNGEVVAGLGTSTYTYITVAPGRIGVSWAVGESTALAGRSKPVEIDARAGETYFFKKGTTTTSVIPLPFVILSTAKSEWGFIEPATAREELKSYSFVKPIRASIP